MGGPDEPVPVQPVSAAFADVELDAENAAFVEQLLRDRADKPDEIDHEFYMDTIGG